MEEEFENTGVQLSGNSRASSIGATPIKEIKNFFVPSPSAPPPQKQPSSVDSFNTFESVLRSSSASTSKTKHQQCENDRRNALQQAKFRYLCNKIS